MNISFFIPAIVASAFGFVISAYLLGSKLTHKPVICFIGKKCDTVLESKYNQLLGFPNEVLGIGYFLFILVALISGTYAMPTVFMLMQLASMASILFAGYMIYLMWNVLHKWCEWCLLTEFFAGILAVIVFLS